MRMQGVVYVITRDQRNQERVLVRVQLQGVLTRPALSMTYEDAANFWIGQQVGLMLQGVS